MKSTRARRPRNIVAGSILAVLLTIAVLLTADRWGTGPATSAAAVPSQPLTVVAPTSPGAERYAIVPDASTATYQVGEYFINEQNRYVVAVGSTNAVAGDLFLDRTNPSASRLGTITVDISTLTSDSSKRDSMIRRVWLQSSRYPTATFVATALTGLPTTDSEGQELTFTITGDLTVRDITKPVTFDARGKIEGDTFTGSATTQVNMTDFGFDPPEVAGLLKSEDRVQLELVIVAKRAG